MLNELFENKFPFVYRYFNEILNLVFENKRDFPQALILEGTDTKTQYLFALELARILNCKGDKTTTCNCINCKWIRSFSHPAVNNVSEIHFKNEEDTSRTLISVKQAREIEQNLVLTSDYHRFFIFFSSAEKEQDLLELANFKNLNYSVDFDFDIKPLTFNTFHQATPNALLKSIEEPPKRTTFVFLTRSKEEILSTIVSRCQCFKLSGIKESLNYNDILSLISIYPNIDYKNAFDISENIQKYLKENSEQIELILNKILEYLKDLMKQNLQLSNKINQDIKIISEAIKQKRANISDKIILDTLFLRIARGY